MKLAQKLPDFWRRMRNSAFRGFQYQNTVPYRSIHYEPLHQRWGRYSAEGDRLFLSAMSSKMM
jgi:hypothetical protein